MALHVYSGGYNTFSYSAGRLREIVQTVAMRIPELLEEYNADAVVVTGKSGHSVAFAALMLADFPLVVVRKETDQSHGYTIEGPDGLVVQRYIILDDFVSSGATVKRIAAEMGADQTCVAVVEYARRSPANLVFESLLVGSGYVPKIGIMKG